MKQISSKNALLWVNRNNIPNMTLRQRRAIALVEYVNPTHFITLSLNQARRFSNQYGSTWAHGDDAIYSETHYGFMQSLSKMLCPRTVWKFHRPILRSACVIEGGKNWIRNHLHMIVAKPNDIDEETFRIMVIRSALNNSWIMNGPHAVHIKTIYDVFEAINASGYSIKYGIERLMLS